MQVLLSLVPAENNWKVLAEYIGKIFLEIFVYTVQHHVNPSLGCAMFMLYFTFELRFFLAEDDRWHSEVQNLQRSIFKTSSCGDAKQLGNNRFISTY